ncbi:hypothetical protein FDP41_011682 [Naegleria fowleri]|uniref:Tyrosine specific protein phosphatases domain-containing protein n=1 Tax=Naegleria fowleri TaxID=5763 RepID=A0A6A5BY69_NAEFO|nr:uncharacterized protein FDP41_011682 [Naegleria fowleri]KAF0982227.1 hypothetical protein FDP41_011682 [Naegleria fowleri]
MTVHKREILSSTSTIPLLNKLNIFICPFPIVSLLPYFVQQELIPRVLNPKKKLLLHCWGGHGRTSTVSCVLLSHLYRLNAQQALERVSHAHSCGKPARGRAPETPSQIKQAKKLAFGSTYDSDEEE